MKKFKLLSLVAIMFFGFISLFPIQDVNAAYAYSWTIGGERIGKGYSNKAGTVSWSDDATYNGGVLTLNNYNGEQIKLECNGTGLGHVFAINLVGENTIKTKGIGIVSDSPIIFIGDGKLTIEAYVPIAGEHITLSGSRTTTVTITPKVCTVNCPTCPVCPVCPEVPVINENNTNTNTNEVVDQTEVVKDETTEETTIDEKELKTYMIITIIAVVVFFILSLLIIISLSSKLSSLTKEKKN